MSLDFPRPPEWMEKAACAEVDAAPFFPGDGERGTKAKKVCAGCRVVDQCLDYALERDDKFGIWGGLDARQRRNLRRKKAA